MKSLSSTSPSGYLHPLFAAALAGVGDPRELRSSGGWILERRIPDSALRDAMGCYPLFACQRWPALPDDFEALAANLVSLSLVPDPFGSFTERDLHLWFDHVVPFKTHYVTDLRKSLQLPGNHRRNLARALRTIRVELSAEPHRDLDSWVALYDLLVQRHDITGVARFSRESFERQLQVPGVLVFKALAHHELVAMHVWYLQGDVGYSHLAASSRTGYRSRASYALYAAALDHFRGRVTWLDLGGAAGVDPSTSGGLAVFKAGWSTGTRAAFVCGKIFQTDAYAALVRARGLGPSQYFPAYRTGEFGAVASAPESESTSDH